MFGQLFRNLPNVTKNLLILNVLFFLATILFNNQYDLVNLLGLHYPGSPEFKPFQIVTHFFMHASLMHIFFNMFGLVIFGAHLERYWGEKRFFFFYVITAFGAMLLYTGVQAWEIHHLTGQFTPKVEIIESLSNGMVRYQADGLSKHAAEKVLGIYYTPMVGASGAIYGLLAAFALLFPNTQFMLLFPPMPIKAKWLALGLAALALYNGYQQNPGDSVAHFAHLGGMIFAFILVQIWKRDKRNFY